jgi:putative oxidoreductase
MAPDLGILLLRLVLGGFLFGHGAQKLLGWFGGPGLAGTAGFFGAHLRLRPAPFWALLAGLSEAGGGLLVALGLLTPLGTAALVAAMLMAVTVHWPRFWAMDGGIEYPLLLLIGALAVAVGGPGIFSADALFGIAYPQPVTLIVTMVLAAIGVATALGTRASAPVEAANVAATAQ